MAAWSHLVGSPYAGIASLPWTLLWGLAGHLMGIPGRYQATEYDTSSSLP